MQALQKVANWLRGSSPGGVRSDGCDPMSAIQAPADHQRLAGDETESRLPSSPLPAGDQASTAPDEAASAAAGPAPLGKRKAPDEAEAAGDGAAKRPATAARPSQPARQQQPAAAAAPAGKRKLGAAAAEEIEPAEAAAAAEERSPGAAPRPAVRPRREPPAAAAPAEPVGSPAPSPYRMMSPKLGAAPLNQLPGYNFSKAAKLRRSSTASDLTTRTTAGSGAAGAAAGAAPASGGTLQPTFRRKLAAPPSRLGGEQGCRNLSHPASMPALLRPRVGLSSMPIPSAAALSPGQPPLQSLPPAAPACRHAWQPRPACAAAALRAAGASGQPVGV